MRQRSNYMLLNPPSEEKIEVNQKKEAANIQSLNSSVFAVSTKNKILAFHFHALKQKKLWHKYTDSTFGDCHSIDVFSFEKIFGNHTFSKKKPISSSKNQMA